VRYWKPSRLRCTGCPTCAVVLKQTYTDLLVDTPLADQARELAGKVMDFSQFATDVLKLSLPKSKRGAVTYHDPCHQVRLKTSDRPRKLIEEAGLDLVEMADSDVCCGFAGSYSIKQPEISESILKRKLDNIERTGACEF